MPLKMNLKIANPHCILAVLILTRRVSDTLTCNVQLMDDRYLSFNNARRILLNRHKRCNDSQITNSQSVN